MSFFTLASGSRHCSWPRVSSGYYPLESLWVALSEPQLVSSHASTGQYSAGDSRGTFCRSPEFLFFAAVSQYSSPMNSDALASLNAQVYFLHAVTAIPIAHAAVWELSPSINRGNLRTHLVCLLTVSQRSLSFIASY